ncbi:glycosyltransferase family 4 protein [Listeria booriae]|uniref:glycosyltransferase family 4 protein n=1 Tax=Listeria booriae TaxID=1552123 RepID=UPI00162601EB|nr:glycosyltransferase family 4 protein [Listeria booriae]MBC2169836.1 glycosyltransferase family 4 protein [Listeria booriae]MBC2194119.1 glycosyltransferase family 4 protein [Listeria booriae]
MNWLFAHDNRFLEASDGQVYSEVAFSYSNWERYVAHVDQLTVIARMEPLGDLDTKLLNLSSGENVAFEGMPNPYGIRAFTPFPRGYKTMLAAVEKADGVIARLPSEIGYMAVKAAWKTNTPYCIEVVGDAYNAMATYGDWKGKLYAPFAERKMRRSISNANHTLYITDRHLQERYPTSGQSVSCSNVELSKLEIETIERRRKRNAKPAEKLIIGMNGSLSSPYKGFETAFQALASIKSELPPFEFRILGRGSKEDWLGDIEQLGLTEHVVFSGTLPHQDVYEWLDNIDIFLMPSKTEGQGRALIEALSRGCSCLGSNVGGIPELIAKEQLHEPSDADGLAGKLIKLATNPKQRQRYARLAFERAVTFQSERLQEIRQQFFQDFKRTIHNKRNEEL